MKDYEIEIVGHEREGGSCRNENVKQRAPKMDWNNEGSPNLCCS